MVCTRPEWDRLPFQIKVFGTIVVKRRLRLGRFMEKTVNICGLCLSQPRTRSLLEAGAAASKREIDAASPHAQQVGMGLTRVSAMSSALAMSIAKPCA